MNTKTSLVVALQIAITPHIANGAERPKVPEFGQLPTPDRMQVGRIGKLPNLMPFKSLRILDKQHVLVEWNSTVVSSSSGNSFGATSTFSTSSSYIILKRDTAGLATDSEFDLPGVWRVSGTREHNNRTLFVIEPYNARKGIAEAKKAQSDWDEVEDKRERLRVKAAAKAKASKVRTWRSRNGKHTFDGKLIRHNTTDVTLEKPDGKTVVVPVEKLCLRDRE